MSRKRSHPRGFVPDQLSTERAKKRLLRDALRPNELRDLVFRRMILSIPSGKVSTYGKVATAAGYPRYHRAVAKLLRVDPVDQLPWYRVVGAGGEIKLRGAAAHEQRTRLSLEGGEIRWKARRYGEFRILDQALGGLRLSGRATMIWLIRSQKQSEVLRFLSAQAFQDG